MRNNLAKFIWGAVMLASLGGTFAAGSSLVSVIKANSVQPKVVSEIEAEITSDKPTVMPCVTVYVYYYRVHGGWVQRRLWNRTYGCWADSRWYNVQRAV